ncbi:ParB N-terminal domain-containing protein [Yersinia intermedia]|uniref:ParB N-terminal domain-containing protein n=1 Tax=Yersinia intermedia TaxID=631 RepID=UPI0005E06A33|nr:ParB N-terminal domain-containing protein [Yersinia intermedia]CNB98928.1 Uncharacterised protein [Yersinia intermedia]CRE78959.1 Uncharacterised protein [Yersinia intermedia]
MERIDFSSWQRINLSVANLKLDRDNPRIPDYVPKKNTKDILDYLFENEKVERLAKKIVDKGFISHDPIYVVKENDSYVVVEGNRRVSALKCLLEPDLAPSVKARRNMERLKNLLGDDVIEKVEVYVAPSRWDVQNVLFELHAEGKLQWSRQQKNKFISTAGNNSGESLEVMADRFNVAVSEIQDSVQEYFLERYFTQLGLPTDIEEKALNSNFSISTISRLVNSKLFSDTTGFKVVNGKLITTVAKEIFDFAIKQMVIDIVNKKINSRSLNDGKQINSYLEDIFSRAPEPKGDVGVEFSPLSNGDDSSSNATKDKGGTGTTKKTKETLISKNKKYNTGLMKLDILIEEAQGLWIDTHKTAGALLLRTILELSVVRIFEIHGCKDQCLGSNGKVKQLSENMKALVRRDEWFEDKAHLDELKRFISKDGYYWNSLESLNKYVHGKFLLPDRDMLRQVWLITEPLVEVSK